MSELYQSRLDDELQNVTGAFFRGMSSSDRDDFIGGLLFVDARGEPVEFTYNSALAKHRFLWRERELANAATRELLISLLTGAKRTPTCVFSLASEVDPALLTEDIYIKRPFARVAPASAAIGSAASEEVEDFGGASDVQLFWVQGRPGDATPAHMLVECLARRGLLLEPFERVLAGLREAFSVEEQ